ncbi:MAG: hypothetical protein QHC79_22510 [Pseudosphingobacterium sp.]|nr:hypothetical protein [Pseudosphingobacterium sp.]
MKIKHYLERLSKVLESFGWKQIDQAEVLYMKFSNTAIFEENIILLIPKQYDSPDFPEQLLLSIQRIVQLEPRLEGQFIVIELQRLAKNIKHKFSSQKKDWIQKEPNSKYLANEIPSIYIPKN